ncbi:LacI family DNA-binding transcriptional regulator, partial [Thermomonas haemolytica]|uniref:LacI family DNA-binding transcriptional regulator n=1 Tax=Thermomonas haemolytica TaxID=141949 RepID=UPI001122D8EA
MDIAHRAGVSQATVSRVLAGSPLVNAPTPPRVAQPVRDLHYQAARPSSSLRPQRADTRGLLLF